MRASFGCTLILLGLALLFGPAATWAQDGNTTTVEQKDKPAPGRDEDPKALESDGWEARPLTFKPHSHLPFPYVTPGENYKIELSSAPGETYLPFPHAGKDGVVAGFDGNYLVLDTNGDDKLDTKLKSNVDSAVLSLTNPDGTKRPYAIRAYKGRDGSWGIQRNGMAQGTVGKTKVTFIDDDSNGYWNDYGSDAVAVGEAGYAAPLGTVLSIEGKLYQIRVDKQGGRFWTKAYTEAAGTLDMKKNFKANGDLAWCVVGNGEHFFDAATAAKGGMLVPAGNYNLVIGELRRGKMSCRIRQGTMEAIAVSSGQTAAPTWGMDVKIEFTYEVSGGKVQIHSSEVRIVGSAKEEYHTFKPQAITPRVQVKDKKSGKDVNRGTMCLS